MKYTSCSAACQDEAADAPVAVLWLRAGRRCPFVEAAAMRIKKAPQEWTLCVPVEPHLKRFEKLEIYLSASINIALHGEPSTPDKFSGAAFKK